MSDNNSNLSGADSEFDWNLAVGQWKAGRGGRRGKTPDSDTESIRNAAACGIRCLLQNREQFIAVHLKELLGILVWKYTEADGKYNTGYVSEKAAAILSGAGSRSEKEKLLCHEHVWERNLVIETLLSYPDHVDEILRSTVACVVTRLEGATLTKASCCVDSGNRWERYRHAGITLVSGFPPWPQVK